MAAVTQAWAMMRARRRSAAGGGGGFDHSLDPRADLPEHEAVVALGGVLDEVEAIHGGHGGDLLDEGVGLAGVSRVVALGAELDAADGGEVHLPGAGGGVEEDLAIAHFEEAAVDGRAVVEEDADGGVGAGGAGEGCEEEDGDDAHGRPRCEGAIL